MTKTKKRKAKPVQLWCIDSMLGVAYCITRNAEKRSAKRLAKSWDLKGSQLVILPPGRTLAIT